MLHVRRLRLAEVRNTLTRVLVMRARIVNLPLRLLTDLMMAGTEIGVHWNV